MLSATSCARSASWSATPGTCRGTPPRMERTARADALAEAEALKVPKALVKPDY
jgi:hypothetical protein